MMLEELNKLMLRDINATLKVNFTTWTDWTAKLRLVLSSGEQVDLVHMAPWSIYDEQAKIGAFYELEELAKEYAPETWASYTDEVLSQAEVDGKVYMLPFRYVDPEGNGWLYRLDLAEKYGLGPIEDIDDMEAYMKAVKENEGIIPYNAGGFDNQVLSESFANMMPEWPDSTDENLVVGQMNYIKVFHNDPNNPFVLFEHPCFIDALEYSRRFYLEGYWPKNVLANTTDSRENFLNGTGAMANLNPINANEEWMRLTAKNPDWKLDWWSAYEKLSHPPKSPANNNGMSIPISSKHPERAMMLLELLHQNQEYADLTTYGIRGVHWDLDSSGDITFPAGVTADSTGFPWDRPCPWGWREEKFYRSGPTQSNSTWPLIKEWMQHIYDDGADKRYADFTFDQEPVAAEFAAIDAVKTQYLDPLVWGMVDPDEGYDLMIEKMYQAGLQAVKDEFNRQWKAYLATK
jgi:putative aldouronate transport system substrate-binding protein